jgi:superfamily II DNA or RNA helicase
VSEAIVLTMPEVAAIVRQDIRFEVEDAPLVVIEGAQRALTFANPEKEAAEREALWGWQELADEIPMWRFEDGYMVLPRGYARWFARGMEFNGITAGWIDQRVDAFVDMSMMRPIEFGQERDYQEEAVDAILRCEQGMWQAPPGAGKTVASLEAIRRSGRRAIVIVDKTNIARQWIERAEQFLGYTPGLVGDGSHDVRELTIAMQQTLWTKRVELSDEGFWDQFGYVELDECHHLPATTFMHTVQQFPARYRIGVSATPDMQGVLPIMEAAIGDVFHTTPKQLLVERGILVKPRVMAVQTDFSFNFWPTHPGPDTTRKEKVCRYAQAGCTRRGAVHRNNYTDFIKAVVNDPDRNEVIARIASFREAAGHCVLVISDRLEHLRDIRELCIHLGNRSEENMIMFTGEQEGTERMEIAERADKGRCVLFSTIANEALDIPRLDTIIFAYPGRNPLKYEQRVGRVERQHPQKNDAWVIDFIDDMSLSRGQFEDRRKQVYLKDGLDLTYVSQEDVSRI